MTFPIQSALFSLSVLGLGLFCNKNHFLVFSLDPFKIMKKSTILTHLLSHVDYHHLFTNFYQIGISSLSLQLSFTKSWLLFFISGLSGTACFIVEKQLYATRPWVHQLLPPSTLTRLEHFISLPKNTFAICGASGAAYGFIGAEVYLVFKKIVKITSGKYSALQKYRAEEDLAHLLVFGVVNLAQIGIGIANGVDGLGHSAHLGGFMSGLLFGFILL